MLAELIAVASLSLASAAAVPQDSAPQEFASGDPIPKLRFERMLPELALVRPIQVVQRAGDDASIFIVEQPGRILVADPSKRDTKEAEVFLDIRERVNDGGNEEGLLSIAFHPEFPKKRELYAYYTASKPRRSVLSRFTVSEDGSSADASSEEVLLTVAQPYSNHNGGAVVFGPDGFLYLSFGDGGAALGGSHLDGAFALGRQCPHDRGLNDRNERHVAVSRYGNRAE